MHKFHPCLTGLHFDKTLEPTDRELDLLFDNRMRVALQSDLIAADRQHHLIGITQFGEGEEHRLVEVDIGGSASERFSANGRRQKVDTGVDATASGKTFESQSIVTAGDHRIGQRQKTTEHGGRDVKASLDDLHQTAQQVGEPPRVDQCASKKMGMLVDVRAGSQTQRSVGVDERRGAKIMVVLVERGAGHEAGFPFFVYRRPVRVGFRNSLPSGLSTILSSPKFELHLKSVPVVGDRIRRRRLE